MSRPYPTGIYLFKVNKRNTRRMCKICSKLTMKTPERYYWRRSGIFIASFEPISFIVFVFAFFFYFELVNTGWIPGHNKLRMGKI